MKDGLKRIWSACVDKYGSFAKYSSVLTTFSSFFLTADDCVLRAKSSSDVNTKVFIVQERFQD